MMLGVSLSALMAENEASNPRHPYDTEATAQEVFKDSQAALSPRPLSRRGAAPPGGSEL